MRRQQGQRQETLQHGAGDQDQEEVLREHPLPEGPSLPRGDDEPHQLADPAETVAGRPSHVPAEAPDGKVGLVLECKTALACFILLNY